MPRRYIIHTRIKHYDPDTNKVTVFHRYFGKDLVELTPTIELTKNQKYIVRGADSIYNNGLRSVKQALYDLDIY